ncbi:MAG: cytochrome c oxidase subunit 3 [Tunicatimonas sp.]|uniref:cytochrome c oxidase subunit 3 n=1 Tax=Tunicatimonas sp. TaxID=1940096 RepID=UPI003C7095B6
MEKSLNIEKEIDQISLREEPQPILSMHPQKFALWLFIVTVVMIFAAFTSAYIVRRSEGNWLDFELPPLFWTTAGIIFASSISMHWAYISAKRDQIIQLRAALLITLGLGIAFLIGQFMAWGALVNIEVFFVGNPAGSFVYVLSGVHGVHIISALIFLMVVVVKAFRYKVHSKRMDTMEMCVTYWHFLDGLWLYLFLFLLLNR